ncbi:hypothetical protein IF157_21440 [Salmonella enterica subsp. enterica serovar Typhimurium]|uniref:Uncharacterized protein n=3 Tax=root TaxID=1 RepID=A0A8E7FXU5_9CAUD|nr:hypothetical protein [Salmonella enterica]YP_010582401.1 hypothetical protein PF622_gp28 [Salmonella phage vB_STM-ZS]EAN1947238.1 hypothetical protein [Salmonella enterica]EHQ2949274.1 hypothetical protein [Salmonella enterica]MBU4707812.1 hypothetical protein [Salmonella enterica subsp. enterica serovar Typhimurium]MBU4813771.1 hypothetical protein [Salmonella enterica subsp. enterica serovar Typhimurium]MBU4818212.1 hypothetical protein [Salmonella enterica subsp. enterica serovar Typhim
MMSDFNIEDCDEVIVNSGSSLSQMLALQLRKELKRIKELEAENARLRQQRDAANAQLDWLLEQPEVSNGLAAKIQES